MESTKVVSFRMARIKYEDVLIYCQKRGIPVSEWLEGRLAIADRSSQMIFEIKNKVNKAISNLGSSPIIAKYTLRRLLRELDKL
jgi:hypothetical protein